MTQTSVHEFGQPLQYDPDFNGPLKRRSCTDVICLAIFTVFIAIWIGIGAYAFRNGSPENLLVPKDSDGRRCGHDSDVRDKPYLFFFDLTKCMGPKVAFGKCDTTQICVDSCPQEFYDKKSKLGQLNYKYCKGPENCPEWYLPSKPVVKRCLYSLEDRRSKIRGVFDPKEDEITYVKNHFKNFAIWLKIFVERVIGIFTSNEKAIQAGQYVVDDIMAYWWKILIGVGVAIVVCMIYVLIMRWIAAVMVWISIVGVAVLLGLSTYLTAKKYIKLKNTTGNDYNNATVDMKIVWLVLLIVSAVSLFIILLMLIFLRKRILLAIQLIKEGSKAVSSVTSVLFFPIFPWLLQIGVLAFAVAVGLYLASTGSIEYRTKLIENAKDTSGCPPLNVPCDPEQFSRNCKGMTCHYIGIKNSAIYPYLQVYNVFALFWGLCFVSAAGQMILAMVFATWYWTFRKSTLPFFAVTDAMGTVFRYHLGTVAFGSCLIAICKFIRAMLEYVDQKAKKYGDNELVRAIMCCMKCFFWCLEKFLKFLNKNAYIMCAIHGKNLCVSARDAFMLLARNIIRVYVLDKVAGFLFFLSKILLTVGMASLAYLFFATDITKIDNSDLHYNVIPVIIIGVCTYLIASLFFSVYSMAVDTLFLCYLEDCERNDGSTERPYRMSKKLMNILGKKNKID